jgi:thiamine biosynthesis lipoprotein
MPLFRFEFTAMASGNELQLWGDERRVRDAAAAAIADVQRIEQRYSRYRDDSITSRINAAAGGDAIAIDAETAALLRYADQCHRASGGRFDLTSGVLRRAWDFRAQPPRVPSADEIESLLALVDWGTVEWSESSVRLPRAGMELDFGGIGKEYAADRAATLCIERGVVHGLVNLGGDVRVLGPQPDGTPWRIGIRDPRADGVLTTVPVGAGALATSGDYQRCFEIGGRRYSHLLDARTGWPVSHWRSISVLAPLCVVAGSYATMAMLAEGDGEVMLEAAGLAWLGVDATGCVSGTLVNG